MPRFRVNIAPGVSQLIDASNEDEARKKARAEIAKGAVSPFYDELFFDYETGVLCCTPNNKMRVWSSSLTPKQRDDGSWLRVYRDEPELMSHEENQFLGDTERFDYGE